VEKWFKVASFMLGFVIVISQVMWWLIFREFSREIMLFGGSLMGFTGFISLDRWTNGRPK